MSLIPLDIESLQQEATERSWQRGESYYYNGAVRSLIQRGQSLEALVNGSDYEPYFVQIEFADNQVCSAYCSCPYDYDGWCKHIVAVLLAYLKEGDRLEQRLPLEDLFAGLDEEKLREVLIYLTQNEPKLLHKIEQHLQKNYQIAEVSVSGDQEALPRITVNPTYYKNRVRDIILETARGYDYGQYYEEEEGVSEEIPNLLSEVKELIDQSDYANAIAILEAITDSCLSYWYKVEEYGCEINYIGKDIDSLWADLILRNSLSSQDSRKLQDKLEGWQDQDIIHLDMSIEALRQGWHYPPLVSLFAGETNITLWPQGKPPFAKKLADIRLRYLKEQERYEDYLLLAKAEGLITEYLTLLVWLDRIEQALTEAPSLLETMEQALALSKALQEQGATVEAIHIAQGGFALADERSTTYNLAEWLLELAEEIQNLDLIVAARLKLFQERPSLSEYQKIQGCTGEDWELFKENLLDFLRDLEPREFRGEKINIFLKEGLITEAIALANELSRYDSSVLQRVMEAAIPINPQWVINKARPFAEEIMNAGKAEYYNGAVNWLEFVKKAYFAAGQHIDWERYYSELKSIHQRKRKLMGLFKDL